MGRNLLEREKYYNRNGWGLCAIDTMARQERDLIKEIKNGEEGVQRQEEENRIRVARYNITKKYMIIEGYPKYLIGNEI